MSGETLKLKSEPTYIPYAYNKIKISPGRILSKLMILLRNSLKNKGFARYIECKKAAIRTNLQRENMDSGRNNLSLKH